MENENDYELVREPKPKGYVRLVRRKAPSPHSTTNRSMEKKQALVCSDILLLVVLAVCFVVLVGALVVGWFQWFRDCKGLLYKNDWIAIWCRF
jgi:hypothetical protein